MRVLQLAIALSMASVALADHVCTPDKDGPGWCKGRGRDAGDLRDCDRAHPCSQHKTNWKCNPNTGNNNGAWC
ncbi:unnamed protein product [Zymoseptoria tritici ST99CH_1A5]|uniref:CBM1 domain-containing protein n=2 Tax=Zymoseptoria tritici TaxID=1047171 RepID=A0A1X7RNV3_ZYMT9|nr:unnamed protein product [Zymoseptoria tritici ST99CH_3D7]SMR49676.1 unnamed protein product [Zymoseptoria tritici ST99CH_3D1]SMY22373.1 unnamed protein product [Zymoseptoria tritici ST99CH_1A5]